MIELKGKYNTALCFCDELEDSAEQQIRLVCDQAEFAGSLIRIMPDVHAGQGCTIGTTMTIHDKIVPAMVGVDIGCGMETVEISEQHIDFVRLDSVIRAGIPAGRNVRGDYHAFNDQIDLPALRCASKLKIDRARHSIGTLGGGNHFIEVNRADDGGLFVVVHSGSRHLGTEVAKYYQDAAYEQLKGSLRSQIDEVVTRLTSEGRRQDIQPAIARLKSAGSDAGRGELPLPKDLAYVTGSLFDDYIHDMKIVQRFAVLNRQAMIDVIISQMGLTPVSTFTTIHNYIDTDLMILRKGAVSAQTGEQLLIPINMRDGSLICVGRGNSEWNYSAPHGAGRIMSRKAAQRSLSLTDFRRQMEGIFTTSVSADTLDESPSAYKDMQVIIGNITPTAEILMRIKPVYNFKASE